MESVSGGSIVGEVRMVVSKASGEVTNELKFPNLVLDVGYKEWLKRMSSTGMSEANEETTRSLTTHLYLGTGTTEPSLYDAGLESRSQTLPGKLRENNYREGYDRGAIYDADNDYYEAWYQFLFKYGEGEAEGVWTELGLSDSIYGFPFTRALIRDDNGSPVSITILSDEFLTVFYTVRFIGEPSSAGTITINGQTANCRFIPGHIVNEYVHNSYRQPFLSEDGEGGFAGLGALESIDEISSGLGITGYAGGDNVGMMTHDGAYAISGSAVLGPSDTDLTVGGLILQASRATDSVSAGTAGGGYIVFDTPLTKRADYRVTIDMTVDFSPLDGPVKGLSETAGSTTLDFTWDTYPNATEYQLVLRQAGTVIEEQTVTTASASFTGLTASTEYHLDIKPIATPRNGRRLIYAASTTA